MTERDINLLAIKTMVNILKYVEWEDGELCVATPGLEALRAALRLAHGETRDGKEG